MKKFLTRFLCMAFFMVLTVVCANAKSVLVVNELTPDTFPLIDGQKSVQIYLSQDRRLSVNAKVEFFSKKNHYMILSADIDSLELGGSRSKKSVSDYYLRSTPTLSLEVFFSDAGDTRRSSRSRPSKGKVVQVVSFTGSRKAPETSVSDIDGDRSMNDGGINFDDMSDDDMGANCFSPGCCSGDEEGVPSREAQKVRTIRVTVTGDDGVTTETWIFQNTCLSDENVREMVGSLSNITLMRIEVLSA